jgi:hypothetical protein
MSSVFITRTVFNDDSIYIDNILNDDFELV